MTDQIKLFAEYGCWAMLALAILAIVTLWKEVKSSHAREISMAERVLPLAEKLTDIVEKVLN